MSEITLSKGVRQNLLSLQGTAELLNKTQERLSTGKKVNSALDNPINFFTSSGLSSRANDLSRLLDSVGNAVQTVAAADKGISAITKLIESASATARQALLAAEPTTTYALTQTGNVALAADVAATGTGANIGDDVAANLVGTAGGLAGTDVLNTLGYANGDEITITDGTNTVTHTIVDNTTEDLDDVFTTLNGGAATWTASIQGGFFDVVSDNTADTITISGDNLAGIGFAAGVNDVAIPTNVALAALDGDSVSITIGATVIDIDFGTGVGEVSNRAQLATALGAFGSFTVGDEVVLTAANNVDEITVTGTGATGLGFGVANDEFRPTNAQIAGFTGQLTLQVGSEPVQTLEFGNGATGEILNRADLVARLAAVQAATEDVTLSITGGNFLQIASTSASNITIGGATAPALGLTAGTYAPTATVTDNASRASLQTDFNNLLTQITELASDASYNGINLLDGDNLTVTFNEDGSSSLQIAGVTFSATGLGLTSVSGAGFQSDANVQAALAQIDTATATLRTQASKFGSNLSIVQARQDFTKNLISVLQVGADQLVLADTNEEGANMLALQTRQQLSTVALSLAAQADQNVLRLF